MDSVTRLKFRILMVGASLMTVLFVCGQTLAFIDYEVTVAFGLQEPVEEITEIGVAFNKGFGVGDTFTYIPLLVAGIIGMIRRTHWGVFSMFGAMSITLYWPIVCLSAILFAKGAKGFRFSDYILYSSVLPIISAFGLWAMVFIYTNRNVLSGVSPGRQ